MLSERTSWVDELRDAGYKYIIMPTRKSRTFYATKAEQKKNGEFRLTASFDEFNLNKNEDWVGDKTSRGVFIRL